MAGKTLDEAKAAHVAYYKARKDSRDGKKSTTKLTFTPAGGSAFTVEGDVNTLATYLANQTGKASHTTPKVEFAGLASDMTPDFLTDVESLEIDAWIALEEESMVSVD